MKNEQNDGLHVVGCSAAGYGADYPVGSSGRCAVAVGSAPRRGIKESAGIAVASGDVPPLRGRRTSSIDSGAKAHRRRPIAVLDAELLNAVPSNAAPANAASSNAVPENAAPSVAVGQGMGE